MPPDSSNVSPYLPWIDAERPIREYRFCVAASFATAARQDDLRKTIEADLRTLAGMHTALAHLAEIRVEVYPWDYFHGQLRNSFPLRFHWFGGLPQGLEPLGLRPSERMTFKAFLDENSLPFVSRTSFFQAKRIGPRRDEAYWVDLLDGNNRPVAKVHTSDSGTAGLMA